MAAPPSGRLQTMLQTAVQSVQWTYSLFWQFCPPQGILIWSDGYYNGAIKTRKTVQPMEVSTEEASLQRSQQLRELYDSLSIGETNQPPRRPCAALSPEDLTESEWFYLMCVSFSFPPGIGLPGKAYKKRQHVWLTGANEVDSKIFSRAILAKSARIQTVVCIPLLDGVVEFGTTDRVQEDLGFVKQVKSFFVDHQYPSPPPPPPPPLPKPALSEHSTSNPATSSDNPCFQYSPPIPAAVYAASDGTTADANQEVDEEEDQDDDDDEAESDSEDEMEHNGQPVSAQNTAVAAMEMAEPSELMQLEMSEDIRLGSPEDASNNLDSEFHLLAVSQPMSSGALPRQPNSSCRDESTRRWPLQPDPSCSGLPLLPSGSSPLVPLEDLTTPEDTYYSQTVSAILLNQPSLWSESSSAGRVTYSTQSAFARWTSSLDHYHHHHVSPSEVTSQWLLKYILFSVPFLHTKSRVDGSSAAGAEAEASSRFRKGGGGGGGGGTPQEELSANHVLAERRRREKLNERFIILRSLVPFVTKMDKASILGDTIEYVKQLRKRIQDLEERNRQMEVDQRPKVGAGDPQRTSSSGSLKEGRSGLTVVDQTRVVAVGSDKRKLRIVEGSCGGAKPKTVESPSPLPLPPPPTSPKSAETSVEVSIIESDGLLELQCPYREGLLLEVMQMLRELQIETTTVRSSLNNGFYVAQLRAKVKENVNGRKSSIVEVKRAINQIIPHSDT